MSAIWMMGFVRVADLDLENDLASVKSFKIWIRWG